MPLQMKEDCKITGYNRHPSIMDSLKEEVLPILKGSEPLQIATVPCSTGIEALTIAVELEKMKHKYSISGFDIDQDSIKAAINATYFFNPSNSKVTGDSCSGCEYRSSSFAYMD